MLHNPFSITEGEGAVSPVGKSSGSLLGHLADEWIAIKVKAAKVCLAISQTPVWFVASVNTAMGRTSLRAESYVNAAMAPQSRTVHTAETACSRGFSAARHITECHYTNHCNGGTG
jgi:hypothetical protein